MPIDHSNDGFFTTSNPLFDRVVVSSSNTGGTLAQNQFMTGQVDGLVAAQNSIPQLLAVAYLKGNVVTNYGFRWKSSNPDAVSVDQSGNCTRTKITTVPSSLLTLDNNGTSNDKGQQTNVGGLATISAIALRPDGSESGVQGDIRIIVQAAGDSSLQRTRNSCVTDLNKGVGPNIPNPVTLKYVLTGVDPSYNS
jgi:hypothetical protein